MERQSPIRDVYKVINKDLVELYKVLTQKLGDNNPFARFNIGGGFYLWTDSRCQWRQMISAGGMEQSLVHDALFRLKKEIEGKFGVPTAELLFTVPDDSYIYYNSENGRIQILVTGWGFKKPVSRGGSPEIFKLPLKNPVSLSFIYDGEILSSYDFGIVLIVNDCEHINVDNTGPSGVREFSDIPVGDVLVVRDLSYGIDYRVLIEDGKKHYDVDITHYSVLTVKAECDGMPLCGEETGISYRGREISIVTDTQGLASIKLPYHEGTVINAVLRETQQSECISHGGNTMSFSFQTPVVPIEVSIEVSVFENDEPVPEKVVSIRYNDINYEVTTNAEGIVIQKVTFEDGIVCDVSVEEYESQSKMLNSNGTTSFRFEKHTPVPIEPVSFSPYVKIVGDNGFVGKNYPISVEYDDIKNYLSDENGIVLLSEMEEGRIMKVTDGLHDDNIAEYELTIDQKEYIFHIPFEEVTEEREIKVMFRDVENMPIICSNVLFKQGDLECLTTLDEDGNTSFSKDTFTVGVPITATINDANRDFDPIPFALEQDEFEYLLQEKNTETSNGKWWLQILTVLVTAVFLFLIWPYFAAVCSVLFDVIYH